MTISLFETGYNTAAHPYYPKLHKSQILSMVRYHISGIASSRHDQGYFFGVMSLMAQINGYENLAWDLTVLKELQMEAHKEGRASGSVWDECVSETHKFVHKYFEEDSGLIKAEHLVDGGDEYTGLFDSQGKGIKYGARLLDMYDMEWVVTPSVDVQVSKTPFIDSVAGSNRLSLSERIKSGVKFRIQDESPVNKHGIELAEEKSYLNHFAFEGAEEIVEDHQLRSFLEERKRRIVRAEHFRFGWNGAEKVEPSWRSSGVYTLMPKDAKGVELDSDYCLAIARTNGIAAKKDQRHLNIDLDKYIYYRKEESLLVVAKKSLQDAVSTARGKYMHKREIYYLQILHKDATEEQAVQKSGNYSTGDMDWII